MAILLYIITIDIYKYLCYNIILIIYINIIIIYNIKYYINYYILLNTLLNTIYTL